MEKREYLCPKCGCRQYEADRLQATGGNFAPIAEASAGKISIYMKEIPSETSVTIPAVLLQ